MSVELWVEKYRPRTLADYVWRDADQRAKVEEWIAAGALPHVLFSGRPGTGKTSLAELLLRELGIPSGGILKINASRERKIDDIQDRIQGFVSTWALGPTGIKYVLLDAADSLSPLAQKMLRGDMENFADACRFIFTCNYPEKIIEAIHSRTQGFFFAAIDRDDFIGRAGQVLVEEGVEFDVETLLTYTESTYPDLRKCINNLQQGTKAGRLNAWAAEDTAGSDYLREMVDLFKAKSFIAARTVIASQAQPEEYPDIYRYFYRNLDLWGDTPEEMDDALLVIRDGLVNHTIAADPEINLSATIVQLSRIRQS